MVISHWYNVVSTSTSSFRQVDSVWPAPGTPPPRHLARRRPSRVTRCEIASLSCAVVRSSVGVAAIGVGIDIATSRICNRGVGTTIAREAATIRAKAIASSSDPTAPHETSTSSILGRHLDISVMAKAEQIHYGYSNGNNISHHNVNSQWF